MEEFLIHYAPIAVVSIFLIKEVFAYLKSKNNEKNKEKWEFDIERINDKLSNHLIDVNKEIIQINRRTDKIENNITLIQDNIQKIFNKIK